MTAVIDIIVPVFGTVAIGWILGRSPLLTPDGLRGLTNVTFFALFPALLFRSMSRVRIDALEPGIIIAFFGTALLLFVLARLLARAIGLRGGDRTMFALASTFSNGVGIGIPFVSYAFGEAGLVPLLMIISVNSLILLTLTSFLLELDTGGGRSGERLLAKLGGAALTMLKHPVIPPIFAGLAWSELTALVPGLATPVVLDRVLQALAQAAPPCGLIMAGASLAHVGIKDHWQPAAVTAVFKLAAMPLLVFAATRYLFDLDPLWVTVATINAAMPGGANVYLMAQLYRSGVGLATNAVVISTGASVVTLSIVLLLLGVQTR
jgi:predicted permease